MPAAAAIAAAVRHATGLPITELPATAEKISRAAGEAQAPPAVVVAAGEGMVGGPKRYYGWREALCVRLARLSDGGCPAVVVVLGGSGRGERS